MSYRDLNPDKVRQYIAEKTSLFPAGVSLSVTEITRNEVDGDGYVNYIYRICDEKGNSVILKQAKPYLKYYGKDIVPLPVERNGFEVDINRLRLAIVPEYVPKLLHIDRENALYIAEDCGRLGIMRFGLSRGRRYPGFPKMMGEFLAKCNFYTSELYLDQGIHKELGRHFTNIEMSRIMETILFMRGTLSKTDDERNAEADPVHTAIADSFWNKREILVELLKLRDLYMKKQECLVHGDLHTSNTMIGENEMKIIDMEYTHLGPFSSDSGYLLGNLVYTYDTWFYHEEGTEAERALYREEILSYINDTLCEYIKVFTESWKNDAKDIFRPYPEYLAGIFSAYLQETSGFMGSQICSRVSSYAETFDFDVLPDAGKRNRARALAVATGYALIIKRNEVKEPADIINIIRQTANTFFKKL